MMRPRMITLWRMGIMGRRTNSNPRPLRDRLMTPMKGRVPQMMRMTMVDLVSWMRTRKARDNYLVMMRRMRRLTRHSTFM